MSHPWQLTQERFLGNGCHTPSDAFAVSDEDAREIMHVASLSWSEPLRQVGEYTFRRQVGSDSEGQIGMFFGADLVGFYEGSCLWIDPRHRGQGLSTPLILTAAEERGGSVLPEGVPMHGYSPEGLSAHLNAHLHAVTEALEGGMDVPPEVLDEYGLGDAPNL